MLKQGMPLVPSYASQRHILFVAAQDGPPTIYRVLHHAEQARLGGDRATYRLVGSFWRGALLPRCDVLYLYRVPLTSRTLPLVLQAKLRGIPVLFDSDDLVWDERERAYNFLDRHPPALVAEVMRGIRRLRAMMFLADALVLSTPYLACLAVQRFAAPIIVHQNALSQAMIAASDHAVATRPRRDDATVRIGYFCGTPWVHDEDLASIAPALAAVLALCPEARLWLYGTVRAPAALAAFAGQVVYHEAVPWDALPGAVAGVDIAIAPVIDNPQRRAKSAVKVLEAALVQVPTVASRLEPYTAVVTDGVDGFLASTQREWADALLRLVRDRSLREQVGAVARHTAIAAHSTTVRAPAFAALLESVVE